jgi:hypothetical protein
MIVHNLFNIAEIKLHECEMKIDDDDDDDDDDNACNKFTK